ncbi:GNAT family N-acetyltransferase [Limosilactobacillus caecicola]|uniref:GNAT family N-acetyltransferase n=1 Tax=Limosilactobacillus caecicola TaxID=2941332 RepID=UPI00203BB490|nr:GNAT family N-acetyltransferase [Limosilactobacillus caecicola]
MEWHNKNFAELTVKQLFEIYKLRATVFNTEQHSDYCDPDDQDLTARHIFATDSGHVVAYARYFTLGDQVSFGRVVIDNAHRGQGLGTPLLQHILDGIQKHFPGNEIVIHAQYQVTGYYAKFDFKEVGEPFIEADRKHIKMIHTAL